MLLRTLIALFLPLFMLAATTRVVPLSSTDASPFDTTTSNAIVSATEKELRAYGGRTPVPGVLLAIWLPNKPPFIRSIGYANLPSKRTFSLDDRFRIGSNTKTFVVTVLLQLVDAHRLKLDDTLDHFDIGVSIPNGDHITVRELMEMRSGIVDAYNTPQIDKMTITATTHVDERQLIAWAVERPPLFPPGTKYNYSNTNYLILGRIIETLTHDTVAHQIEMRLIQPFGLTSTTYPTTDPNMPAPYAHGYDLGKDGSWKDVSLDLPPSLTGPAGVMISTVPDMRKWVMLYVTGATNSPETQRERLRCIPIDKTGAFGLGIGCSAGWYGYTGGLPGYNTTAIYLPSKGVTIIAFVTSQRESPSPGVANSIVHDITKILFPKNVFTV